MCNYFSCIIKRDGAILFCEEDSHETIIDRAGLTDDNLINREFVRIEITPPNKNLFTPYKEWTYTVDEDGTLPPWYCKRTKTLEKRAWKLMKQITTYKRKYLNIEQPAMEEYENIQQLPWEEYEKIEQLACEEYMKIQQPALEEYEKIQQPAMEKYLNIERPAWEEYLNIEQQAWKEYFQSIQKIDGYTNSRTTEGSE